MTGAEIHAFNLGKDRWESVTTHGTDKVLAWWLDEPYHSGEALAAYEALGPTVFKRWLARGAAAAINPPAS